jgi:hypothetical protein
MKKTKTIRNVFLFAGILFSLALVSVLFPTSIYGYQGPERPWLKQFENGPVKIVFIKAPPEMERIANARLISVETSGLVLRFSKSRNKFFPYANIISVDPR